MSASESRVEGPSKAPYDKSSVEGWRLKELVEAARQADRLADLANGQQRPRNGGGGRRAGVMADRQALVGGREDDLGRNAEAWQPEGVDLGRPDSRTSRL